MKIDIQYVAKLAKLPLKKDRIQYLEAQLNETLAFIERLNEIPTKGVEPTSQVTGLVNVARSDSVRPSLSQTAALQNATSYKGFFVVDAIFEE